MKEQNILLLSAGRRIELIELFKKAAKELKITSNIVAADCDELAPGLYFADKKYVIPRISSSDYIDSIISISRKENISLIVPTIDTELIILSQNKNYIEEQTNSRVLISNEYVISTCRDKEKTNTYLEEHGFNCPKLFNQNELKTKKITFPLFIKPKSGSSSIDTFKINSINELEGILPNIKDPIIQEFVSGVEYTVDALLDFDSKIITIVPRQRLSVRGGEIIKGKICKDQHIINEVKRLLELLNPIGPVAVQLIKESETNKIKFIEINPRFGGGAPMSILSGADFCKYIYMVLDGDKITYNENYEDGLYFLRFDKTICINNNKEIIYDKSTCF
ncbi:MAG: ATP-grasp domain-containing protein [Tissierellales bacterium]|nr:ATP-grasp domain-containing protein [Tissierellales bacterium]